VLVTEVFFCGERVVSVAAQRQVGNIAGAAARERQQMMDLKMVRFRTAFAALVHVGAPGPVSLENSALCGRRNVPAALAR
jgi:hypothetical protein